MFTFQSFTVNKMDELVFENRNKDYGAYVIRKSYSGNLFKSLGTTLLIVGLFMGGVLMIGKLYPNEVLLDLKAKLYPKVTVIKVLPSNVKEQVKKEVKKNKVEPTKKKETNDKPKENTKPIVSDAVENNKPLNNNTKPLPAEKDSTDGDPNNLSNNNPGNGKKNNDGSDNGEPKTIENEMADVNPEFPGGENGLIKFLSSNLRYPEDAAINGTRGTVFIKFIVDTDGSVTNIEILNGVKDGCSEEAERVVKKMPKWKPGIYKKKPVKVIYRLPVKFKL